MAEYIENVLAQTSKLDWAFPFERKGGFPLDKSALFSSLEDAQKYATGSATDERKLGGTSYVGQIISVYEPANEEAGTSASVNAYIITPARGLIKLAATTASGDVAGDIADLQGKVNTILGDIEALEQAIGNVYTKSEVDGLIANAKDDRVDGLVESVGTLEENLGKEIERAAGAEKALGERIDAIDFVDETELATALEPYAKTADVNTTLAGYTTTEGLNTLLEGKVDKTTYAADKKALEDEDAAIRAIAEDAQSKIDTFLEGTDTDDVVNKLKEIQAELEELGDAVQLEEQFAAKADLTYVNAELAKKQDVIAENTYDAYGAAATAEQNAKDYADGLAGNYDASGSAATAEQNAKDYADGLASNYDAAGAASDVKDYADETFATKAYVGTIPSSYTEQKTLIEYVNKKAEETLAAAQGGSSETAASVKLQLDNYKTENEPKFEKLEGIAAGAQVNVLEGVQVDGTDLVITDKKVNINLTPYAKQADLETVSGQANKGVADAASALAAAQTAQGTADTNAGNISTLQGRMETAEGTIGQHATALATHATEYADLKGRVDGHDTAIAGKADKTVVEGHTTTIGEHTASIADHETRLTAAEGTLANKADASALNNYYTKSDIDGKTGVIPEGSSLMAEIAKAQTAATYDDTKVKEDIAANATAIENITKAETGAIAVAKAEALAAVSTLENGKVKDNADAIAILNGDDKTAGSVDYKVAQEVAKILNDNDSSDIDTLEEIAAWIKNDTAGVADLNRRITANETAINDINDETTGILAVAKKYTDDEITALDLANSYDAKGAAAGALTEAKGYTDAQIPLALASYKVKEIASGHEAIAVSEENGKVTIGFATEIVLNGGSATL